MFFRALQAIKLRHTRLCDKRLRPMKQALKTAIMISAVVATTASCTKQDGTSCKCTYKLHDQTMTFYKDTEELGLNCGQYQQTLDMEDLKCVNN